MGMVLSSGGALTDDFNYGYPYGHQTLISPPYYDYSTSVAAGQQYASSSYRRKDFTLQYLSRADNSSNTDMGAHGGSSQAFPNYLMWPVMNWTDTQAMSLIFTMSTDMTLTYDRSFDGYTDDLFVVVVNGKEVQTVTHTAGYSWTTSSIGLAAGICEIHWVLQTADFNPIVLRNGVSQDLRSGSITYLPRYMRITNLQIA